MKRQKSNRWKMRILSASSKIWKTSKYFDKDLCQVVLSAQKIRRRKKEKKRNQEETTIKSNLLKWTVREEKRHWIKQQKPTWNQWKRSYQLNWISILCLATDFACLRFRFSLVMETGCLKLDWAKIFIESFNIKLL